MTPPEQDSQPVEFDRNTSLPVYFGDRYILTEFLGRGGYASVFKAKDTKLRHFVAIKILRASSGLSQEDKARFENEARTLRHLRKEEHTVNLQDIGQIVHQRETYHCIIMEYLQGRTLTVYLEEQAKLAQAEGREFTGLTPSQTARIMRQVATSLQYAHDTPGSTEVIIHRDLKPENIMVLDGVGEIKIKVMDFGIAKAINEDSELLDQNLTFRGELHGTPWFSSPEHYLEDLAPLGRYSDLYCLGLVAYSCLTGKRANTARYKNDAVFRAVKTEVPFRLPEDGDYGGLGPIVNRLLEMKPERRYQTCSELLERLDRTGERDHVPRSAPQPTPEERARAMATRELPEATETEAITPSQGLGYTIEDAKTHTGLRAITPRDRPRHTPSLAPQVAPAPSESIVPETTETLEFEQPQRPAPTPPHTPGKGGALRVVALVMVLGLGALAYIVFGTTPSQGTDPEEVDAFKDGVELADFPSSSSGDDVTGVTPIQPDQTDATHAAVKTQGQPEVEGDVEPATTPTPGPAQTKPTAKAPKKVTAKKPKMAMQPKAKSVEPEGEKAGAVAAKTKASKAPSNDASATKDPVATKVPKATNEGTSTPTKSASATESVKANTSTTVKTEPAPTKRKRRRPIGLQ